MEENCQSQSFKQVICQGFVEGVWQDASNIAEILAERLRKKGIRSSLDNSICCNTFAAEWSFARLIWLRVVSKTIVDGELRQLFVERIEASIDAVVELIPDLANMKADYAVLAAMWENGDRDQSGHRCGPGPIIALRYQRHIKAIRETLKSGLPTDLASSSQEDTMITLLGDGACWRLQGELNQLLGARLES